MDVAASGAPFTTGELYPGTPCWIELSTNDLERACAFYTALFGWDYEGHSHERTGEHVIAHHEGYPVASLRRSSDGESDWRLYLATEDVEETSARALDLGARISVPRSDVPDLGAKVVCRSPADDRFGLLEPAESLRFDVGLPGTLMWAELVTIRAQAADHFFQKLFGYEFEQFGSEHASTYSVWYLGGESVLARVSMIREYVTPETRPHWLLYLGADPAIGTDDLVHEAVAHGGRIRVDPYDTSLGRVSVLRDPTGARFALIDSTQAVSGYSSAANYDPYDD